MSYGVPDDVGAAARVWSNDGHWVDADETYEIRGTNPTLATVTEWLTNVSAMMDLALQASWFNLPVDPDVSPTAYNAIKQYVVEIVADMADDANGVPKEIPPIGKIMKDMQAWVSGMEDGFLADGMTQTATPSLKRQISFRVIGTIG